MGRGRDTLWIDPVSRSSSFKLSGIRELSLLHDNGIPANNSYTGCSSSANSSVTAISCSAHLRKGLILA